jgi:hypothetical protein
MGKRSNMARKGKDLYRTFDPRGVAALAPHLPPRFSFAEPCASNGILADQLRALGGEASFLGDVVPARGDVVLQDALTWRPRPLRTPDFIITNPPWSRPLLHRMIVEFSSITWTWLLFDYDWSATLQAQSYFDRLYRIQVIGRMCWFPKTNQTGKDNAAWYLFGPPEGRCLDPMLFPRGWSAPNPQE